MKTALKAMRKAALVFAIPCLCAGLAITPLSAEAQNTLPPTPAVIAPVAPPSAPAADATPKIVSPPADATLTAATMPGTDKEEKEGKSLGNAEDKVSDSVKGIAKRLSATDNVTLDDLNSAKQAVTKIEALIDLEKHLNELDKIRSEREGGHSNSLPSPVPISALSPYPAGQMPQAMPMPMPAMPASVVQNVAPSFSAIDVTRITGSDGRFTAVVKTADGQTKTVQVGDHIEGATVSAITSAGVELERNNTKHLVAVKNVQTVFGNTP